MKILTMPSLGLVYLCCSGFCLSSYFKYSPMNIYYSKNQMGVIIFFKRLREPMFRKGHYILKILLEGHSVVFSTFSSFCNVGYQTQVFFLQS